MVKWLFPRRILHRWLVPGAALWALAASASAEPATEDYSSVEITPFYGYMTGGAFENVSDGSDRDIAGDSSFGIIFNAAADKWRHYEFIYARQSTQVEGTSPMDIDIDYLQIGGTVSSMDATYVIPYFGITLGAARLSPKQSGLESETKLAFSVGGGVKVPITEHIGVRFDARAFIVSLDTDGNIFCESDDGTGTCTIRAKSDTLLQYSAALGVTVGF